MKRKLALLLTVTLLAGSLDSGMLVSAADFSAEESVEQAVEEEPQPEEEISDEKLTDTDEELPSDETEVPETETVNDPGEDGVEMTESSEEKTDISSESEADPELEEEPEQETESRSFCPSFSTVVRMGICFLRSAWTMGYRENMALSAKTASGLDFRISFTWSFMCRFHSVFSMESSP